MKNFVKKSAFVAIILSAAATTGCANMGGSAFPSVDDRIVVERPDGTVIKAQGRGVESADIYIEDTHNRNGNSGNSGATAIQRVCQEEEFRNHPSCQGK